jgi:hypothetical protein
MEAARIVVAWWLMHLAANPDSLNPDWDPDFLVGFNPEFTCDHSLNKTIFASTYLQGCGSVFIFSGSGSRV